MDQTAVIDNIKSINVLYVDDDESLFPFIKLFLSDSEPNMKVTCVSTQKEVIDHLKTGKYHCLVTDYNMPGMNGIELAAKIKEKYSIPIVIYTGRGSEEIAEKAFAVGIDDYIRKEVNPSHYTVLAKRIRGIVEKKQLEKLNIISQKRLSSLIELSPNGIATFNKKGYMTFLNDTFCKLTGFNKEDLMGKHFTELQTLRKRDLLKYIRSLVAVLQGKKFQKVEFAYNKKDGSNGIGEAYLSLMDVNGTKELLLIARDISEQKKWELAYNSLFETLPHGMIELDVYENIVMANKIFKKQVGLVNYPLLGENFVDLPIFELDEKKKIRDTFNYVKKYKKTRSIDFEIIKLDGKKSYMRAIISPILFDKELIRYILVLIDVTIRKKSDEAQKNHIKELERIVDLKTKEIIDNERFIAAGKTASMIGHDLRTPLQVIKNCVYILKKNEADRDSLLRKIDEQIEYCTSLISQFEDQTKINVINFDYVSISNLIDTALSTADIGENITVMKKISRTIPLIKLDAFQFKRVLINIFNNAVEAMPDGGQLLITAEVKKGNLELSIADSGKGIPEDVYKNIFKPFYTTKKGGLGLGLSFCKNIVEAHGGVIEVSSKVGEGTTVFISVPVNETHTEYVNDKVSVLTVNPP